MSDTPRTFNAWHAARRGENPNALLAESARLERELAEARLEIKGLKAANDINATLRESVEKLAARFSQTGYFNSARELRALLK